MFITEFVNLVRFMEWYDPTPGRYRTESTILFNEIKIKYPCNITYLFLAFIYKYKKKNQFLNLFSNNLVIKYYVIFSLRLNSKE